MKFINLLSTLIPIAGVLAEGLHPYLYLHDLVGRSELAMLRRDVCSDHGYATCGKGCMPYGYNCCNKDGAFCYPNENCQNSGCCPKGSTCVGTATTTITYYFPVTTAGASPTTTSPAAYTSAGNSPAPVASSIQTVYRADTAGVA